MPVQSLHLVTRYTGASPEDAPLHRLGTDQWAKAKRKAAAQARDTAAELLNLYAQRAARSGTKMEADDPSYQRFALQFPFEETEDQQAAIDRVLADLESAHPMDRVVCGDVGFGKTEVALRSAFAVVQAGYQVAVLVPTTLLADQHYRTFQDRFADWPVRIELLSRFRSGSAAAAATRGLADGTVDIVIGTHKLLQTDVRFKNLGLVIVDEEHRFGVKDKERLKRLRAEVHVLTLTATPIPRTLNMTLGGLRDLSIIATPPAARLAVKTFVGEWSDRQIREAVLRELRRGGQIYFVHNRVENIEAVANDLRRLLPEAEIRVGHGQMSERELEAVMLDFYHRQFNVLVCTTIIESGIDIPTANTIIINRADKLGLAQLHQLRGRVGRSHHQAYAYLLAPPRRALTPDALKRLEAIESLEDLGAGFTLATHDLEIRGAGELLGEGQSGQIQAIGFTLYNELLGRAVAALREGREPDLEDPFAHGPEIEIGLAALIPEDYMPDVHMRLVHYKRIANARIERRARRAASRADRPLRSAAAAAEDAVRDHLAEAAGAAARHREDPGRGRRRQRALRRTLEGRADEAAEAHRRRAEALSPRRAVQAALRLAARGARAASAAPSRSCCGGSRPRTSRPRRRESEPRYTARMKKLIAALAGALLAAGAGAALGQITAAPPAETPPIPRYQVEIIVFAHRDFDPSEERFAQEIAPAVLDQNELLRDVPTVEEPAPLPPASAPTNLDLQGVPPVEDPLAVRILAPEELQLGSEYRRVTNLRAYRPLVHAGWIQPGLPEEQSVPFDLASIGVTNPRGTIRVYLSRFLHVSLDLTYRDGASTALPTTEDGLTEVTFAPRYHLVTERQARSGELHYFDHPAFGVLLKVTPVPVETGGASTGRRPAA